MTAGEPIRVLLLLGSLQGGGAERVAVNLLNHLDLGRFDVRMGLLRASGPYLTDVPRHRLMVAARSERFNFEGSNRAQFTPAKLLRGAIAAPAEFRMMIWRARPDVVVSFLKGTNLIAWRALAGLRERPKWIAREGNNAAAVIREEAPFPLAARMVTALTARAYRRADCVLATSASLARELAGPFGLDPARIAAIHNPVDTAAVQRLACERPALVAERPFLLAAGRLEHQKGFDVLLRAYATSGAARSHDLVVLGSGSVGEALRSLAMTLGISQQVHWPGFQTNPFGWMAACDLFVLSSRWEGFASVVAEAMAAGAPVLATACDYGPPEIVEHGISGWLVAPDDASALAGAIGDLLRDQALRDRLAAGAATRVERFAMAPIIARYAALIERVARG